MKLTVSDHPRYGGAVTGSAPMLKLVKLIRNSAWLMKVDATMFGGISGGHWTTVQFS